MKRFESSEEFMQHLRELSIFSDEGYPSESLLAEMLKIVGSADPTRPDYSLSYYRHHDERGTDSGIDAYSYALDDSARKAVDDSDAPTQLYLIYFISSTSGASGIVDTETIKVAMDEVMNFYARCRNASGPPSDIQAMGSEALLDLVDILREGKRDIDSVRIEVFTDLEVSSDATYTEFRTLEGLPVVVDVWAPERLWHAWSEVQAGKTEDIILSLSDEGDHPVLSVGSADNPIYITALKGDQLARFYAQYQLRAVNENVRAFLEFKGKTNLGIRDTINLRPGHFMSYNNGLTIVASRIEADAMHNCPHADCDESEHPNEDSLGWAVTARSIHDVQIVNGGQTTAAIYHCWKDGMQSQVEELRVFAKIVIVGDADHDERDELVSAIAKFSNSQNKVDPATLESNIPHFKALAAASDVMPAPSGLRNSGTYWYFDRAPGRYTAQCKAEGQTYIEMHPSTQVIDKYEIAEIVNCVIGRPTDAQKGKSGSFSAYRKLLKERNRVSSKAKDRTPRGLCLFGDNAINDASDIDDYEEEWRGTVSSVIVLRRLKAILDPKTVSWMRTISRRYVLAMAYLSFAPLWDRAWKYQSADEAYRLHWGSAWPSHPTLEDWAEAALRHVDTAMKSSARLHPGKGENQRGQMSLTWERAMGEYKRSKR
jgi:hypothetical protein